MVAGPGSFDSLANALPHVVAKRGALGVFCCASAETGRGGALKVEDGSFEAMEIAALHLLEAVAGPLGEAFDPWRERPIRDGNGAPVGVWSARGLPTCYSPALKPPAHADIPAVGRELPALFGRFRFAQFAVAIPSPMLPATSDSRVSSQGECRRVASRGAGGVPYEPGGAVWGPRNADGRVLAARYRGARAPRRGRPGEGLLNVRRDRHRARRGRDLEGAGRGPAFVPDRPRHRRARERRRSHAGRAGRREGAGARPHGRALARLAAPLPARHRPRLAAHGRAGGACSPSASSAATCAPSRP